MLMRPLLLTVLLGTALGCGGCTSAPVVAPRATAPARLTVTNLTGFTWRITVASAQGAPVQASSVGKYAALDLRLEAGDYIIEQTLLDAGAALEATRRFPLRIESAQEYRWSLATLLAADADRSAPATPKETASRE